METKRIILSPCCTIAATAQPGTMSCWSRRGVPCGRRIPTPPASPPVGPKNPGEATTVLAGNM
eukprot:5616622-Pyramimonas_sp.AAC.1